MMQLRHVRYFVATADAGSVSSAAARVHVTQPALSRQLRQLEQDLGVTLFDRSAGRLALNRTGRALLPGARRLLDAADALQTSAAFHGSGRLERLTIAAPTVTLTDVVSPFVATMSADDPVVDVRGADALDPAEMLRSGADLAIGTQRPPAPYAARELAVLPVWAYVPSTDPWAARGRVPLAELLERPLLGLPATFTAREALDAAALAHGSSYAALVEAANGTIAQALAASGRGVAVVSDDPRFGLVPLAVDLGGELLTVRLVAAWDPRAVAAETIGTVARRLGEWVTTRYGAPTT
ncbi:LysR family transcriptional regulator [Nocardioides sp. YIM 152315]|uniref:LysR family transcriptional regulator n=1 Tax=Nocardioides sp. YIM 152315 TaxID=3031760 RepID=UPI0023DC17A9|nr:LysR family transcriptional regulator [Nocardioides sp. YIM 152315]MDF1604146.1 LysR family transcriptional regulator [Nocardioides sp. YIM 152315]